MHLVEAPSDHASSRTPPNPHGRAAARLIQCSRHAGLAIGTDGARCRPRRAKDDAAADGAPKQRRACNPARCVTWLCAWQSDRRVVVTGMGIVSCLGNSQDEVADSLHKAKAGIKFSEKYKEIGVPAVLTGQEGRRSTRAGHPRASVRARGAGQRAPGPPHAVRMPHARRPRESCTVPRRRREVCAAAPRHEVTHLRHARHQLRRLHRPQAGPVHGPQRQIRVHRHAAGWAANHNSNPDAITDPNPNPRPIPSPNPNPDPNPNPK